MDGDFACPECGNLIEVVGLTPGRQTRCEFCGRLVEIPFIPRLIGPGLRRTRLRRSPWIILTWAALSAALMGVVILGTSRILSQWARASRKQAIDRLIESASRQRDAGAFGPALIELDTAIDLLKASDANDSRSRIDGLKITRGQVAREEAERDLAQLSARADLSPSDGGWLRLRSRIAKDPDLAALRSRFEAGFQSHQKRRIDTEYRAALTSLESRKYEQCLEACARLDRELRLVPPDIVELWRTRIEELLTTLIRGPGVVVTTSEGHYLEGGEHGMYLPELAATATRSLREKGYLPPPPESPWGSLWSRAPFRLNLEVIERREGNYQATRNRLTRIDINLILSCRDSILWRRTSTARSSVPLPKIPVSLSNRLAINSERIEELEKLLYSNARSMVGSRLAATLEDLPPFPTNLEGVPAPG